MDNVKIKIVETSAKDSKRILFNDQKSNQTNGYIISDEDLKKMLDVIISEDKDITNC